MKYQILGGACVGSDPRYRGIYRRDPEYQEQLPASHLINRAWREYVESGMELDDLETARRLTQSFRVHGESFDLVQVGSMPDPPEQTVLNEPRPPVRMGFDIAQHRNHSLLSWNLHWVLLPPPPQRELFRLLEAHFRPKLNDYGLFEYWTDARFFLDLVEANSAIWPGTWEAPGYEEFEILELRLIRADDGIGEVSR